MRPLSYSQISTYRQCPLLYKLHYIDGLKTKERSYFSFGSTVHKVVEYFYGANSPVPPSLDSLVTYYAENWQGDGYSSKEEEEKYRALGEGIITGFWQTNAPSFHVPVATEYRFSVDIEGIKLSGIIDRIDKLASGGLSIVDYKTSREFFTRDHLENDLQLTLYQIAAGKLWSLPVEKLTLYHLRSNTPCTCGARTPKQLDEAKNTILTVAENIVKGNFEPAENAYCPCDFPEHCPFHKQKYAPVGVNIGETATSSSLAVPEAIERYISIQSRIKELEMELDELKAQLVSFCESQQINRLHGLRYQLTMKRIERLGFKEEEVKALLEPLGLWIKVLGYNEPMVKQFIEGTEITAPIRKELERLRKVKSSYPQFYVKKINEDE